MQTRIEHDSMGDVEVPAQALYGAQTQRAVDNFPISGQRMPRAFLRALGSIKAAAAAANQEFGLLEPDLATAIEHASGEVRDGLHDDQFPIDIYQTGSGTSTNMNANEVIATLAARRLGRPVHPNDHVNCSQSSNDVIPSAIHVSAYQQLAGHLLPALDSLAGITAGKAASLDHVVKNGRTHLMDAMPVRMSQELGGWQAQFEMASERIRSSLPRLAELAIGGTAVGTGVNAPRGFGQKVAEILSRQTGHPFRAGRNYFALLSTQETAVEVSGHLRTAAVALLKVSNDLRWMNSGPVSGLSEIRLSALQPGSSIMPGKVNPVIPEAVAMVCVRVIGNDASISMAAQTGNFQLNVMLPLIASALLEAIDLLGNGAALLARRAIAGFEVNADRLGELASRNAILATVLNARIGYEKTALIVRKAIEGERSLLEVAAEMTDMDREELLRLLDPLCATEP
jgi:fumarate hydratase class II